MVPMQATILVNVLKRYMFRTFTNRWTPRYMRCSTGYNETIHEFSKQSDRFLIVTIDYIYIYIYIFQTAGQNLFKRMSAHRAGF
jgi:hypothetical protein